MVPQRDLGDDRLWHASNHRSLQRRRAAAARGAIVLPSRAATASIALVASAVALPSGIAGATTGLAAVQQALGVTADGVMGPQTRGAIKRFQREHDLTVTGRVGPQTRAALGTAGATRTSTQQTTGSVRDVQEKLGLDADGIVGPKTRAAVSAFQAAHDLEATGRLDGATRSAILQSEDAPAAKTRSVSLTDAGATAPDQQPAAGASAAVDAARGQIGKPYRSAGSGPGGFDCSGLTVFAFKAAGITLARSSFGQYAQGTSIDKSQIQAGDLVFFNSNGGGASHVGIAASPTTMISATTRGVMENSFTSGYWASHYVGARRVSAASS